MHTISLDIYRECRRTISYVESKEISCIYSQCVQEGHSEKIVYGRRTSIRRASYDSQDNCAPLKNMFVRHVLMVLLRYDLTICYSRQYCECLLILEEEC